jgi:hypothetical protein|tara:strand:+ start:200 stop:496 length:297 start_codon:yes stop_codon:yes gene_type:complete
LFQAVARLLVDLNKREKVARSFFCFVFKAGRAFFLVGCCIRTGARFFFISNAVVFHSAPTLLNLGFFLSGNWKRFQDWYEWFKLLFMMPDKVENLNKM